MAIAFTASLVYSLVYAVVAYIAPAWFSFKTIESTTPTDVQVKEWLVYWFVLAVFYCSQPVLDFLLCWLPLYYVAKLAFIVALWHPQTRVANTVYTKVFGPLLSHYESDIDKAIAETRSKGADFVGTHAQGMKKKAIQLGGQASTTLNQLKQKALERAQANKASAATGHGLHTE